MTTKSEAIGAKLDKFLKTFWLAMWALILTFWPFIAMPCLDTVSPWLSAVVITTWTKVGKSLVRVAWNQFG